MFRGVIVNYGELPPIIGTACQQVVPCTDRDGPVSLHYQDDDGKWHCVKWDHSDGIGSFIWWNDRRYGGGPRAEFGGSPSSLDIGQVRSLQGVRLIGIHTELMPLAGASENGPHGARVVFVFANGRNVRIIITDAPEVDVQ